MWEGMIAVFVAFGFPVLMAALGLGFAAFNRYLKHKEWMKMIEKGIVPEDWEHKEWEHKRPEQPWKVNSTWAVVVTLVGIAITIGLSTIGIGPWLIGGLVPTAIGCGLLISQFFGESKERKKDE